MALTQSNSLSICLHGYTQYGMIIFTILLLHASPTQGQTVIDMIMERFHNIEGKLFLMENKIDSKFRDLTADFAHQMSLLEDGMQEKIVKMQTAVKDTHRTMNSFEASVDTLQTTIVNKFEDIETIAKELQNNARNEQKIAKKEDIYQVESRLEKIEMSLYNLSRTVAMQGGCDRSTNNQGTFDFQLGPNIVQNLVDFSVNITNRVEKIAQNTAQSTLNAADSIHNLEQTMANEVIQLRSLLLDGIHIFLRNDIKSILASIQTEHVAVHEKIDRLERRVEMAVTGLNITKICTNRPLLPSRVRPQISEGQGQCSAMKDEITKGLAIMNEELGDMNLRLTDQQFNTKELKLDIQQMYKNIALSMRKFKYPKIQGDMENVDVVTDKPEEATEIAFLTPPDDVDCRLHKSAFCIGWLEESDGVKTQELTNIGDTYDSSIATATDPCGGIFLMAITIYVRAQSNISVFVSGTNDISSRGIYRVGQFHQGIDTLHMEFMAVLPPMRPLSLAGDFKAQTDVDSIASWTSIRLSSFMHPLVAFCVTQTGNVTKRGKIAYDDMTINEGGGFRKNKAEFVAPERGVYYISYSVGAQPKKSLRVQLRKKRIPIDEIHRISTSHKGVDTLSRSTIIELEEGESIHLRLLRSSLYSSREHQLISFSGFLYKPIHGRVICWNVCRSTSFNGIQDPITFGQVMLNKGFAFNDRTNQIVVKSPGKYYVQIHTGAQAYTGLELDLVYNGKSVVDIERQNGNSYNGFDSLGRTVMLDLKVGDTLHVSQTWDKGAVYSDIYLRLCFSGFLVYVND